MRVYDGDCGLRRKRHWHRRVSDIGHAALPHGALVRALWRIHSPSQVNVSEKLPSRKPAPSFLLPCPRSSAFLRLRGLRNAFVALGRMSTVAAGLGGYRCLRRFACACFLILAVTFVFALDAGAHKYVRDPREPSFWHLGHYTFPFCPFYDMAADAPLRSLPRLRP